MVAQRPLGRVVSPFVLMCVLCRAEDPAPVLPPQNEYKHDQQTTEHGLPVLPQPSSRSLSPQYADPAYQFAEGRQSWLSNQFGLFTLRPAQVVNSRPASTGHSPNSPSLRLARRARCDAPQTSFPCRLCRWAEKPWGFRSPHQGKHDS